LNVSVPSRLDAQISIIVPCWHDAAIALDRARYWSAYPAAHEIIVSAVGIDPRSPSNISKIKTCASPRASRGRQMNIGAHEASGDVLLFHHVDSELTNAHLESIAAALRDPAIIGGAFYRKFDERHPMLRWFEPLERLHLRFFGTIYGDQSVFVRREIFWQLGGFAPIPLMEDVEFSKRLRRVGPIALLDPPMRSSPRRQIEQGSWRVTFRNLLFLVAYKCGVSAHLLHHWYYGKRQPAQVETRIPSLSLK
jgi:Glycosyl transferase family 2